MPASPSRPPTEKPAIAKERVHFVGIGGIGLSAIARILLAWGTRVSGSDLHLTKVTDDLVALGARIAEGHAESNVGDATLLVMSSAIPESNPEIQAARRSGVPVLKRADFVGEMMAGKLGIAVAGTHGKTTTTAMIAHLLVEAELDPSFIVGGIPSGLGENARAGQGDHFVIEADEYDGMFLGLNPRTAVVTHLEIDHPDCYPTLAEMCRLEAPVGVEGISIAPLLAKPDRPWKRAVFSQYPRARKRNRHRGHGDIMGYAVRTDRYRYVEWREWKSKEVVTRELYDHENDSREMRNIAGQAQRNRTVEELAQVLARGWKSALPAGTRTDQR